jgi:hypothetical protein
VQVGDNSGSLTIDAPVGTPAFVRLSDGTDPIATLPVSVASIPSHAVTNAGTFVTQIDGAALTALQLLDNVVAVEDAAAGTGYSGIPLLAVRQDSQVALAADGDFISPTIDNVGGLRVSIVAGAGSGGTALADDADFTDGTTSGTPVGGVAESASPTAVTEGDFGWAAITLNRAFKTAPYTPAGQSMADDTADAIKALLVDAAGATLIPDTQATQDAALGTITDVTGAMTFLRASASAPSAASADGDAVLAWGFRNGAIATSPTPNATTGLSTFHASAADGSSILVATAQAIKASAGQLYGYYLYNPEAAVTFVHFYNTAAASVTVGTTAPLFTLPIPPESAANLMFTHGVTFSNAGWSCAATTTAGGNTAPATGVSATVWYL